MSIHNLDEILSIVDNKEYNELHFITMLPILKNFRQNIFGLNKNHEFFLHPLNIVQTIFKPKIKTYHKT